MHTSNRPQANGLMGLFFPNKVMMSYVIESGKDFLFCNKPFLQIENPAVAKSCYNLKNPCRIYNKSGSSVKEKIRVTVYDTPLVTRF